MAPARQQSGGPSRQGRLPEDRRTGGPGAQRTICRGPKDRKAGGPEDRGTAEGQGATEDRRNGGLEDWTA
eukprot:9006178-Pyramimonas_sp.AAC.1